MQDLVRRLVSLLLATACLLVVPEVALATFGAQRATTQTVSTATLARPAAVTGTWTCEWGWPWRQSVVGVNVANVSGDQPRPVTYRYTLKGNRASADPVSISGGSTASLSSTQWRDLFVGESDTWTLTVTPVLGQWTGPSWTREFVCNAATGSRPMAF